MARISIVCILIASTWTPLKADKPQKDTVKKVAKEMLDAFVKGDYAKTIDFTYPGVVKELGGRKKAIEMTETAMKEMKAKGIEFKEVKLGDPGEFLTEGKNTFVVVPTINEMTFPKGTLRGKFYLLGISPDGGKSWTFADGTGMQDKELRDKILPKLPEKLNLPEVAKPEIFPNDK